MLHARYYNATDILAQDDLLISWQIRFLFQTSMYLGVYGGIGVVEAVVEVLREMILLLSCTAAGRCKKTDILQFTNKD